ALTAPVPANLALVHRDWIEAALAGETDAARDAVGGGGAMPAAARRWLQRRALGALVAMPAADDEAPLAALARAPVPALLAALAALVGVPAAAGEAALAARARAPVPALLAALAAFGRDALAAALTRAAPREVAEVAARLGEPHASALVARVAALSKAPAPGRL